MTLTMLLSEVLEIVATALECAVGLYFVGAFGMRYRDASRSAIRAKYAVSIIVFTLVVILMNNLINIVAYETLLVAILIVSISLFWIYDCTFFSIKKSSAITFSLIYMTIQLEHVDKKAWRKRKRSKGVQIIDPANSGG